MSRQEATGATKRPRLSMESPTARRGGKHPFETLPKEILIYLTQYLDDRDLVALSHTCTSWNDTLKDEAVWRMKCSQHSLQPSAEILRTSETPWRVKFLENLQARRNWRFPNEVTVVRTDEKLSRHRGEVIAVGYDRVLTLDDQKILRAWNTLTGDFCWERLVNSSTVLLSSIILHADFPDGRGTIISPENGETLQTWDMGVITKVALHDDSVVAVSDEGYPGEEPEGLMRFWSADSPRFTAAVRIARCNVDHLVFDGETVIVAHGLGIEVWSASECIRHHFYPNRDTVYSLFFDEAKMYISFVDSEFVQVSSLGDQHERQLVPFEKRSSLHLSEKFLIGLSPEKRVKVWDKLAMRALHDLDFGSPIVGVSIQGTHLITHTGGSILTIRDLAEETARNYEVELGLPDGCRVHKIYTNESKLVVDVRMDDLLSSLLIMDFNRPRTGILRD